MECQQFDELIQEMLDCRQFRPLPDDATDHVRSCTHCRSNYSFYQQLGALTASPCSHRHGFDSLAETVEEVGIHEPVLAPVLRLQPARQPGGMWRQHWLAVAALLCLSLVAWRYWPGGGEIDPNTMPLAVVSESDPVNAPLASGLVSSDAHVLGDPAANIELASKVVAGVESKPPADPLPTYPTPDDFQKLTAGWDESVVALDRQWQQMAAGRVRAHQIPGLQPAVYPITGAVEAFRKTMIVRNQNGVAAGVRW
jgi:hypothetical protein